MATWLRILTVVAVVAAAVLAGHVVGRSDDSSQRQNGTARPAPSSRRIVSVCQSNGRPCDQGATSTSRSFTYEGTAIHESGNVLAGVSVRLRSIRAPGFPITPPVHLTTRTGEGGRFAFANIPASGERSCYEVSVPAGPEWSAVSTRWIVAADTVITHDVELIERRIPQRYLIDNVGVPTSARRQCGGQNHR
jgi:hypothetical protein